MVLLYVEVVFNFLNFELVEIYVGLFFVVSDVEDEVMLEMLFICQ